MAEAVKIKTKNRKAKTLREDEAKSRVTDEDILKAVAELPEIKDKAIASGDQNSVTDDKFEECSETKTSNIVDEEAVSDCEDDVVGEATQEVNRESSSEAVSTEDSMVTASEGSDPVSTSQTTTADAVEEEEEVVEAFVEPTCPEACAEESSDVCQSTSQTVTEEDEVFEGCVEASCPEAGAESSDVTATAPEAFISGLTEKDDCEDIKSLATEQSADVDCSLIVKGGLYPDLELLAMACSSTKQEDELQPFTNEQLRSLYCNHQLEHQEEFVDVFLLEMDHEGDEFHEILQSYLRARNNLCSAEHDIQVLVKECSHHEEMVWQTKTEAMVLQGQCQDKAKVTADHSYEVVSYSEEANEGLSRSLKMIRCHIHDELSLAAYEAQLSRLKVESYLHQLFMSNPSLRNFPRNAPVIAHLAHQLDRHVSQQVTALKRCISILFAFQRKPAKDPVFVSDTQKWLSVLVGTLLRTATLEDHLFILHHLLRCPPGVCKWGTSLLQVLPPGESSSLNSWGSPLLDHTLTVLAYLMKSVRKREDVLYQLKVTLTPPPDKMPDNPWILVDSEGEEDEDPHNSWWLPLENDVVALLQQIPLQEMFGHILFITHTDEGRLWYNIERTSEAGFLKLIAFATYFLDILGEGLQTYSQVRYRQLNKRIGRMISHTVHYIADHWENFHQVYAEALADSSIIQRLHIEIDALCHRAVTHILSAQRLGSWQFLTDLPYWCISLDMMWRLLWLMHQGHYLTSGDPSQGQTGKDAKACNYCRKLLEDVDTQHWFETKLTRMPISEVTFLLTTFANMARSRPLQDIHFIESITCEIFEIAYVWNHTRELCSKPGRELLASIATKHPCIISTLLQTAHGSMDQVGMVSIYLFKELPIHLWTPREGDLAIIREWLLDQPQNSAHNQLGRVVLEKLNWSYKHKTQELFLDMSLHMEVAVLIVETYTRHLAGKPISGLFTEGLEKASSPGTEDVQLASWAWHLALRLYLHGSQRPMCTLAIPDVHANPKLQPIQQGFKEHYSLATYIALIMGKQSHNVGDFCAEGVRMLALLADKFHYVAVIRALSHLAPLFYTNVDILISNKEFMQILHNVLSADGTRKSYFSWEFPGPVTRLFCHMIIGELSAGLQSPPSCGSSAAVQFWLSLLVNLPTWNKDKNVLYLIDKTVELAFTQSDCWDSVLNVFLQKMKAMQPSEREAGVFSSLTSWLTPSPTSPTLIDSPSCPEYPWFAYAALNAETQLEDESQLWSHLQSNLVGSPSTTVDLALKRAAGTLKLEGMAHQSHRLCIYRWAQQALETPESHPLLPLLWQRFFLLYLGRQTCDQGMPQRASVGERFFDSVTYNSLMKRMKKRLSDTASHFHRLASSSQEDLNESCTYDTRPSSVDEASKLHLQILVKYFQTLSYWLDEPRLHDSSLYLPALPSQYESNRLLKVFNRDITPWREYVDMHVIAHELDALTQEWRVHSSHDLQAEHWHDANLDEGSLNATERILKRIQEHEPHVPPPNLEVIQAPLPLLDNSILCHQQNLLYTLRSDFNSLVDFAKLYCLRVSRHVGLDMSVVEYYPHLFKNEMTEATIHAHCKSSFNPLHRCKGPAAISVRYEAKARNNIISRKLDENRVEYKQLMIEAQLPPPQNLCAAAVHVEDTIKRLIGMLNSSSTPQTQNVVREVGTALFYHMAGYVSEDTKYYPPTQQFFAACIEVLGQEFIHNNPTQSQPLLAAVLQMPALVSLLAPNFSPNASPELFITMYQDMLRVPQSQGSEVAFTLLTKFDVHQWLSVSQPAFSERSLFVATLSEALYMCGSEPNETLSMVFQIYRLHLQQTLQYRFPDHFGEILKLLVKGCHDETLSIDVWGDFLGCLGCHHDQPSGEFKIGERRIKQISEQLSYSTVAETIEWLGNYFMRSRLSSNAFFGLYPKWKPLVPYLCNFFHYLVVNLIKAKVQRVGTSNFDPESGVQEIWMKILELYAPWIQPLDNKDQILSPCILNDLELASQMTSMWLNGVNALQTAFEDKLPKFSRSALSLLWPFYLQSLARKVLPEFLLHMYHKCLLRLPWAKFWPDIEAVQMMLKIHSDSYPSCCTEFLGRLMTCLRWPDIVCHSVAYDVPDIVQDMHQAMFTLLVRLSIQDILMNETPLPQLISAAESFNWNLLAAGSYNSAVNWFLTNCDPRCVMAERSSKASQILCLLKVASGFVVMPPGPVHPETPVKRCMYMRCMVQLISKCSHLKDINVDSFRVIELNLLTEIETVVGSIPDVIGQRQEALSLGSELLGLLNTSNPRGGACEALLTSLLGWLSSSPSSPMLLPLLQASGRCLASLSHMACVIEASIEAYFSMPEVTESDACGWSLPLTVLQVPERNCKEFLKEAVAQGGYLCLYAYTLQQLPLCQSMADEKQHIEALVEWTCAAKPSGHHDQEVKLILWWSKIFELIMRQLDFGSDTRGCVQALLKLIPALNALGEDRASGGLMGVIGLGRKSQLSIKFRLMCRCLSTFLSAQIPSDLNLRQTSNAPGYLAEGSSKRRSSTLSTVASGQPSQSAVQLLAQLEAIKTNKQYAQHRDLLECSTNFIVNPDNCIRDVRTYLMQLLRPLYPDVNYLRILFE